MNTPKETIFKWFTGKKRENAEKALNMLLESEKEGQWIPKASRFCLSALTKANVAEKLARSDGASVEELGKEDDSYLRQGWRASHCMKFGHFMNMDEIDFSALRNESVTDRQKHFLYKAKEFRSDFAEVARLMETLDNTRPKPVFTFLGLSRTVTATLKIMNLDLDENTVRVCPIEFFKVQVGGKWESHIRLLWPEGTVHGASRFCSNFTHCEACGHAIHNPFNWVPILMDDKKGVPHSMWIGRDCAQSIFGIKVKGEVKIEGRDAQDTPQPS